MDPESVMVKAKPQACVPLAEMELVLHVGGGFHIPSVVRKRELLPRAGFKLRRIGDGVLQLFMDRAEEGIHADFPVVMTVVPGKVATDITFAVAASLRDDDGRGQRIGRKRGTGIAHAAGEGQEEFGRNSMLKGDLCSYFGINDVLPLAGVLLNEIVGDEEAHYAVRDRQAQAVPL